MNSLVAELVNVSAKERFSLDQCIDFLSGLAALQVILNLHYVSQNLVSVLVEVSFK